MDESDDSDWVEDSEESDSDEDDLSEDEESEPDVDPDQQEAEGDAEDASEQRASDSEARADTIDDAIEDARAGTEQTPVYLGALQALARGAGLLRRICESCRHTARHYAHSVLCGHVYDNINMMFRIAEQILGRKDSQENGTCATMFPLFDAHPEDMRTADLLASLDQAPPLSINDILHTPEEAQTFQASHQDTQDPDPGDWMMVAVSHEHGGFLSDYLL